MGHPTAVMRRKRLPYIALQRREGLQARSSGSNLRSEVKHQDEPRHSRRNKTTKMENQRNKTNKRRGKGTQRAVVRQKECSPTLEEPCTPRPGAAPHPQTWRSPKEDCIQINVLRVP